MARGHFGLPRPSNRSLSRQRILGNLQQIDNDQDRRARVLRLETAFRNKIETHIIPVSYRFSAGAS